MTASADGVALVFLEFDLFVDFSVSKTKRMKLFEFNEMYCFTIIVKTKLNSTV